MNCVRMPPPRRTRQSSQINLPLNSSFPEDGSKSKALFPGASATRIFGKRLDEGFHHTTVESFARSRHDFAFRLLRRKRLAIRSAGGHLLVSVGHRQNM